ncbi:MAG: protoheme IX farnesyltransferase [Candidatus Omnitrophica bacterium]|nr:protoheme IX farnesyltransferase [Candidatus Omnitrophota bacterium]
MSSRFELTKPRLTFLAVLTTLWGFATASPGRLDVAGLGHTLFAAFLLGGGVNALNQFFERETDAKMKRTEQRPIPSGRLTEEQAFNFGLFLSVVGILDLLFFVNVPAALTGLAVLITYLVFYTPLKQKTGLAVFAGAVPGALPPVMGWAAGAGRLDAGAAILFAVLFFWQLPHFFAISWMYREDYAKAGIPLLLDWDGKDPAKPARWIFISSLVLFAVTLAPPFFGLGGTVYLAGAVLLGILFCAVAHPNRAARQAAYARQVFLASIAYLPLIILFLIVDGL